MQHKRPISSHGCPGQGTLFLLGPAAGSDSFPSREAKFRISDNPFRYT
jgi:hypothetical protein